jgi:hypothetical protein
LEIYICVENRNDPDLVQAFQKKWWVESDFKEVEYIGHICKSPNNMAEIIDLFIILSDLFIAPT